MKCFKRIAMCMVLALLLAAHTAWAGKWINFDPVEKMASGEIPVGTSLADVLKDIGQTFGIKVSAEEYLARPEVMVRARVFENLSLEEAVAAIVSPHYFKIFVSVSDENITPVSLVVYRIWKNNETQVVVYDRYRPKEVKEPDARMIGGNGNVIGLRYGIKDWDPGRTTNFFTKDQQPCSYYSVGYYPWWVYNGTSSNGKKQNPDIDNLNEGDVFFAYILGRPDHTSALVKAKFKKGKIPCGYDSNGDMVKKEVLGFEFDVIKGQVDADVVLEDSKIEFITKLTIPTQGIDKWAIRTNSATLPDWNYTEKNGDPSDDNMPLDNYYIKNYLENYKSGDGWTFEFEVLSQRPDEDYRENKKIIEHAPFDEGYYLAYVKGGDKPEQYNWEAYCLVYSYKGGSKVRLKVLDGGQIDKHFTVYITDFKLIRKLLADSRNYDNVSYKNYKDMFLLNMEHLEYGENKNINILGDFLPSHMLYSPEDYIWDSARLRLVPVGQEVQQPFVDDFRNDEGTIGSSVFKNFKDFVKEIDESERIPIIFVHGLHSARANTFENLHDYGKSILTLGALADDPVSPEDYWRNLLTYMYLHNKHTFKNFKPYLYVYPTYKHITYNGRKLTELIEELADKGDNVIKKALSENKLIIVAHSQGTLVSRSAMEEYELFDKVKRFIALAGVHHGTPSAIESVHEASWWLAGSDFLTPGTCDLMPDNYDGVISQQKVKEDIQQDNFILSRELLEQRYLAGCTYLDSKKYSSSKESFDYYYLNKLLPTNYNLMYGGFYVKELYSTDFEVPKIPNPWLAHLNTQFKKEHLEKAKEKYALYGGYLVTSDTEEKKILEVCSLAAKSSKSLVAKSLSVLCAVGKFLPGIKLPSDTIYENANNLETDPIHALVGLFIANAVGYMFNDCLVPLPVATLDFSADTCLNNVFLSDNCQWKDISYEYERQYSDPDDNIFIGTNDWDGKIRVLRDYDHQAMKDGACHDSKSCFEYRFGINPIGDFNSPEVLTDYYEQACAGSCDWLSFDARFENEPLFKLIENDILGKEWYDCPETFLPEECNALNSALTKPYAGKQPLKTYLKKTQGVIERIGKDYLDNGHIRITLRRTDDILPFGDLDREIDIIWKTNSSSGLGCYATECEDTIQAIAAPKAMVDFYFTPQNYGYDQFIQGGYADFGFPQPIEKMTNGNARLMVKNGYIIAEKGLFPYYSTTFRITEQALDKLEEILPGYIFTKLESLKNHSYTSKDEFVSVLEETIGEEQTFQYEVQILEHTLSKPIKYVDMSGAPFHDVPLDHKYIHSIRWAAEEINVVKGYVDGYFRPEKEMTWAEFLKLVLLASGIGELDISELNDRYKDDPVEMKLRGIYNISDLNNQDWGWPFIYKAHELGILPTHKVDLDRGFNPQETINVKDATEVLMKAFELDELWEAQTDGYPVFEEISPIAYLNDWFEKPTRDQMVDMVRFAYDQRGVIHPIIPLPTDEYELIYPVIDRTSNDGSYFYVYFSANTDVLNLDDISILYSPQEVVGPLNTMQSVSLISESPGNYQLKAIMPDIPGGNYHILLDSYGEDAILLDALKVKTETGKTATILVIDVSGSMDNIIPGSTINGITVAKEAAKNYVDSVSAGDLLGIVKYSSSASIVEVMGQKELIEVTEENRKDFKQAIENLTTGGSTNHYDSVDEANGMLDKHVDQVSNFSILLMTDGQSSKGDWIDQEKGILSKKWFYQPDETSSDKMGILNMMSDNDRILYTVGLGDGIDDSFLENIAGKTGGTYTPSPDPNELATSFGGISDASANRTSIQKISDTFEPSKSEEIPFIIDSSVGKNVLVNLNIKSENASIDDLTTSLVDPDGYEIITFFRLTEQSLQKLKAEAPEELKELIPQFEILKNKTYASRSELEDDLETTIGNEPTAQYKSLIFKYTEIGAEYPYAEITVNWSERSMVWNLTYPKDGKWIMRITSHSELELNVTVSADSPLKMIASTDKIIYQIGETVRITVSLSSESPVLKASVWADISYIATDQTSKPDRIYLYDDGKHGDGSVNDGTYGATYLLKVGDTYDISINAKGYTKNGDEFTRQATKIVKTMKAQNGIPEPMKDDDQDELPDIWEETYNLPTDQKNSEQDTDGDNLTDLEEFNLGSNPSIADSDGDGISDGDEINKYGTSPIALDSDGDGVPDNVEIADPYSNPMESQDGDIFCDFNYDLKVTDADISLVKAHWPSQTGHPNYDPAYDVDHDGSIDVRDINWCNRYYQP